MRIQVLLGILILSVVSGCALFYEKFPFEPLEFPFAEVTNISGVSAFGIPNWSGTESHNGIDLQIYTNLTKAGLISPTKATVSKIEVTENTFSNPPGTLLLSVYLFVNYDWEVKMVIEPGTINETVKSAQKDALMVAVGQQVDTGQAIGDLLVGELGYPHLHYMVTYKGEEVCAYRHSSVQALFIQATNGGFNNLPNNTICN